MIYSPQEPPAGGPVTFEQGVQAWKTVIDDTSLGAKRLYESMSGLRHSLTMTTSNEIQMEGVEEADVGDTENGTKAPPQQPQPSLRSSGSKEDKRAPAGGEKTGDSMKQSQPGVSVAEKSPRNGGGDEDDITEDNISNEQFMYALRKRLKEAQKNERELAELKKKYLEASVTSEQLVIMLGRVS